MNQICVNEQPIEIKEWRGQRVVTFKDIDRVHQRPEGTASRNFRANRKRFIEGVDFFAVSKQELPTNFVANSERRGNPTVQMILLTEMGYLMLVKSFTDDLAWQVQRALVMNYFRAKEEPAKPKRKMLYGTPVMTTKDLAYFLDCPRYNVNYLAKKEQAMGTLLEGEHLQAYKRENGIHDSSCRVLVFHEALAVMILKNHGVYEQNKDFLRAYFEPEHRPDLSDNDMKLAVRQADILYKIAREIKDPVVKEMNYKAVTALLINIGLWDGRHAGYNGVGAEWSINSTEGWNKLCVLMEANRRWQYNSAVTE